VIALEPTATPRTLILTQLPLRCNFPSLFSLLLEHRVVQASRRFASSAKESTGGFDPVTIITPVILSTVVVVGLKNMDSVASDIRYETHYGHRYTPMEQK
jgi:hypothetical protein